MTSLVRQRCLNHATREAAARCPECERFFCRECISEHDDRILCSRCLAKIAAPQRSRSGTLEGLLLSGQCLVAAAVIWFVFFLIGRSLLETPANFHDGTIWESRESK